MTFLSGRSFLRNAVIISALFGINYAFSADDTPTVDYSAWSDYANSIETCSPGEFILPEPGANLKSNEIVGLLTSAAPQLYKIQGWQGGKCVVSNKENPPPGMITTGIQYCSFPKEALPIVAEYARQVAAKAQSISAGSAYALLLRKDCMVAY